MDRPLPYSVQKLVHHPEALQMMREGKHQSPTQIHFMPALACNQSCGFCSYGHRLSTDGPEQLGWKNMALMSDDYMPRAKMLECIRDWREMGVCAIELTGGGEPLIYPHVDDFLAEMASWRADLALVTNGTALTPTRAAAFGLTNWKWARVSIDAGDPETYAKTRRVPSSHWTLAWRAVSLLAGLKTDIEQRVGVGYVIDHSNYQGVYDGIQKAVACGADNIRVALAFTPQHLSRFPEGSLGEVALQLGEAKYDFGDKIQINDLVSERTKNIENQTQDYRYCAVKEVLCVVGGDQQVYTCCTLAFNPKGLIGSIKEQSFQQLWEAKAEWFARHDARKVCKIPCLYEMRNKRALDLLSMSPEEVASIAGQDQGIHKNFI